MKKELFGLMILPLILVIQTCYAQSYSNEAPILPLKNSSSVLFGQDVVINSLPFQNQKNIVLCSAQNGWIYAAFSRDSVVQSKIVIMRSKDLGLTWQHLGNIVMVGVSELIKKIDFVVIGNNPSEHKLIMVYAIHEATPWSNTDVIELGRFNCDPLVLDTVFFSIESLYTHDIALASDIQYPALSSNPHSIGVLYSRSGTKDSIIFLSSGDGGYTFNNRKVVAVTTKKFHKVAISYGRSLSKNTGRYFAAWEEQQDVGSSLGHIYTAHSEPNYNSSFTTPFKLDGLDPSLTNFCRNPSIACQANNIDNDSSNLTEIVIFEKYNGSSDQHDITGFYNKKSTSSNSFTRLNIAATQNNEIQPDLFFNPYDSTFMTTYYDSTLQKLPFLNKQINLIDPDTWNVVSFGYNDDQELSSPYPQVSVNHSNHEAITAWTKDSPGGNGVSMFDALYFSPVGIKDDKFQERSEVLWIYPNPCKTTVSVGFETVKTEKVAIVLYNAVGQPLVIITDREFQPGKHRLVQSVSRFPAGIYFLTYTTLDFSISERVCIVR